MKMFVKKRRTSRILTAVPLLRPPAVLNNNPENTEISSSDESDSADLTSDTFSSSFSDSAAATKSLTSGLNFFSKQNFD